MQRVKLEKREVERDRTGKFQPGTKRHPGSGRPAGRPNRHTRLLREAILLAAESVGEDCKGKGQLIGYLRRIAIRHADLFVPLLAKILPLQLVGQITETTKPRMNLQEMEEHLRAKGLPLAFDKPLQDLPEQSPPHGTRLN